MNNEQLKYIEEDEIDLRELFNTIIKRKKFIIIFTSIITLLSIIWVYTRIPIYEVKSNVQIGFIGEKLIADPDTLIKTTNIMFNVEDKPSSTEKFISEVSSVTSNKKLKNFITIKTQAISNQEALNKNKEVVKYIQDKYIKKVEQFIKDNNNNIKDIQVKISNIDNLEKRNLKREIEIIKTQDIAKIDEKINFLQTTKLNSIQNKIKFHNDKLKEYTKSVNQIYNNNKNINDPTTITISSIQMVNYQNLILNSQNKIEDLKIEKEKINTELIPNLKRKKENIKNDELRQLDYKLRVIIPNKKALLSEEIEKLKFKNSNQYIQNSQVIGDYIIKDYPIKPNKKLIIIVSFITGLILSIFLVFFLEFIRTDEKDNIVK